MVSDTIPGTMTGAAAEMFEEIRRWPIYDPHSHIQPLRPASRNFDEVLGYHYYTELAHSAGMPAALVGPDKTPRQRAENLAGWLDRIENTVQYSWLLEIARTFYGFTGSRIGPETIDALYASALREDEASATAWDRTVWDKTGLEAVFLTNDFDDPLEGWDTTKYVPCLRTDDLVLKLSQPGTVARLQKAANADVGDLAGLRAALGTLFSRFAAKGARACAISLPPDFVARRPDPLRTATPLRRALRGLELRKDEIADIRTLVFWTLAELCADFRMPFDLMIGPIREVYPQGVSGGRDLFDRRVSLADYQELFRHFSQVTFPVSTLSPDAGGELVAYSWIFPNVIPMGHWWYSNIPAFIAADLSARIQAVPGNKIVGYYSDAYKLEFILPKFRMFQNVLCQTLARDMVAGRGWSVAQALTLARAILRDNPKRIFAGPDGLNP